MCGVILDPLGLTSSGGKLCTTQSQDTSEGEITIFQCWLQGQKVHEAVSPWSELLEVPESKHCLSQVSAF